MNKKIQKELEKGKIGIYLYGIIPRSSENPSLQGFDENPIKLLHYKTISAIISKAELKEYEPNEKEINLHKTVAQSFLASHDVLPVAYGMVFKSKKILLGNLRKFYPKLRLYLRKIKGKVELGVKVLLPKQFVGKRAEVKKKCEKEFSPLTSIANAAKGQKLYSERLAFNASFLVDRKRVDEFSQALEEIGKKLGLKASYSGPWPPYNFVDIRIMKKS